MKSRNLPSPFSVSLMNKDAMNRQLAVTKLREHDASVRQWYDKIETLIRQGQHAFGLDPLLMAAFVEGLKGAIDPAAVASEGDGLFVLDPFAAYDHDSLSHDLPSGVGSRQAIGWAARHHGGESYTEIAADTTADADTVEVAACLAASSVGIPVDSQASPDIELS